MREISRNGGEVVQLGKRLKDAQPDALRLSYINY